MSKDQTILVTGGAGYIGSITCKKLLELNYNVIIIDDLSTGYKQALPKNAKLYNVSLNDKEKIKVIFKENADLKAIIHFAGSIEVSESVLNPSKYFNNNIIAGLNLIDIAKEFNIEGFIFSSSAAVYGIPCEIPISETSITAPVNPYGLTKLHIEEYLKYYNKAYNLNYVSLRYFNACGSYKDLGENHKPESHLIPSAIKVVLNKKKILYLYGNDYDTNDGTAIRDYIHVEDLALAHIYSLEALLDKKFSAEVFNIGNGYGYSVMDIIKTIEKTTGLPVPISIKPRRLGDPPVLVANTEKIQAQLCWKPIHNIESIIESAWNWHKKFPDGYV